MVRVEVEVGRVYCYRCMKHEVSHALRLCDNCGRGDRYRAKGGRRLGDTPGASWVEEYEKSILGGHEVDYTFWRGVEPLHEHEEYG